MEFTVFLAGYNILVRSIYPDVYDMCRDYMVSSAPDFSITISPSDIEYERVVNIREMEVEGLPVVEYSSAYLETLAVYRKIVSVLLDKGVLLMHGAVVAVGSSAWLFTAPSGTGKTTHINLWLENIPGSYVVNGDKPLISVSSTPVVYGTPWAGKEGMNRNVGVPLSGIVFLSRGLENSICEATMSSVLPTFIQQCYRPRDKKLLEKSLALVSRLGKAVPLYRLSCNMDPSAAHVAYEFLSGDVHE
ncbi:MAG: hypothetical protein IKE53_01830 [Clostridiales bacterium]|nr:hypothetical protein [Clostridiales bacterium]